MNQAMAVGVPGRTFRLDGIRSPIVANYLRVLTSMLSAPVLARALGPSDRGIFALATAIDALSTPFFSFGVPQAVTYFETKELNVRGRWFRAGVIAIAMSVPLAIVLAGLLANRMVGVMGGWAALAIFLFIASSPLTALAQAKRGFGVAQGHFRLLSLEFALPSSLMWVSYTGLWLAGWLTLATALSVALGARAIWFACVAGSRLRPASASSPLPKADRRRFFRYGLAAWPSTLTQAALVRSDQIIIFPFLSVAQVGNYAVGATVGSVVQSFSLAASGVLARTASMADDGAERRWRAQAGMTLAASCLLALGTAVASPLLMPLVFGRDYRDAGLVASAFCLGSAFDSLFLILRARFDGKGRPGIASTSQVGSLLIMGAVLPVVAQTESVRWVATGAIVVSLARVVVCVGLARHSGLRADLSLRNDVLDRTVARRLLRLVTSRQRPQL